MPYLSIFESMEDSKTQVTCEHILRDGVVIPTRCHTIVISVQHAEEIGLEEMKKLLKTKVLSCREFSGRAEILLVFRHENLYLVPSAVSNSNKVLDNKQKSY